MFEAALGGVDVAAAAPAQLALSRVHGAMSQSSSGRPDRRNDRFGYWPVTTPFIGSLVVLMLIALILINVAGYAYERVGLSVSWFQVIIVASILGSRINIPVARFPDEERVEVTHVVAFGVRYRVPSIRHNAKTVLAVNVGGALIPAAVSVYLIYHDHLWVHALAAVLCVTFVMRLVARPVVGIGIVTPALVPPVTAAIVATVVGGPAVAALAYVCGTLGTLIGADILNLSRIRNLGAPVASVGGAGTFDGVFLAGILAVVLATL